MTAACLAFAAVVYAPLAALTWTSALPSAKVLAALAGLAVICTAVAFLLFFRLIAEVGPAAVARTRRPSAVCQHARRAAASASHPGGRATRRRRPAHAGPELRTA